MLFCGNCVSILLKGYMKQVLYKKILVTHDGSTLSSAALPHALLLAKTMQAQLILLRVIESYPHDDDLLLLPVSRTIILEDTELIRKAVVEEKRLAKQQLEAIKKDLEKEGAAEVITYVEEGFTRDVILDIAKTEHIDLIIIATRGRTGLGRVLLGSVADHIVRYAPCPVLTIHPQKGGK